MELRNSNLADDPCARLEELLPAYGMGLSDPEEALEVEALLARCPEMASDLEEYRQLAAYLPMTSEAKSAPSHLLTQILVAAASEPDQLELIGSASSSVTQRTPRLTAKDAAAAAQLSDTSNTTQTLKTSRLPVMNDGKIRPAAVMPFDRAPVATNNRWRGQALFSMTAAVLVLVLFLGSNLFWASRVNQQETTIEETQKLIETFGTNQIVRFDLGSVDQASPEARGTIWCHPDNTMALVKAENIPVEAQDQDLKVVLWRGEQREEAGDVWINDRGEGIAVVTASLPLANYDYVVIAQPSSATGTNQPRPFMRGNLY